MNFQTKPPVSMLLIAYKQADTIKDAIVGALAQTYSPLEIIISDDASPDNTFQVIKETLHDYRGPHQIIVNQNISNIGIGGHLSKLAEMAKGELLFIAAGDDISLPERCERVVEAWLQSNKKLDLIATDLFDMDEKGEIHSVINVPQLSQFQNFEDWAKLRPRVIGAAHTWTPRLFEKYGPLNAKIAGEDSIMVFRAIMEGGALTLNEPLVRYRRGGVSSRKRRLTIETMIARLRFSNSCALAETDQLLKDASKANIFDKVQKYCLKHQKREFYVRDLFDASTFLRRLLIFLKSNKVDLAYRLRIFGYLGCPIIYRPFFFLKRIGLRIKKIKNNFSLKSK